MSGDDTRVGPNSFRFNTLSCLPSASRERRIVIEKAPIANGGCGHPAPFRGAIPIRVANTRTCSSSFA
jgi:hypothetical protein